MANPKYDKSGDWVTGTYDTNFGPVRDVAFDYPVLELARQIVDMGNELQRQREAAAEGEYYKKQYMELLNSTLNHNRDMTGNLLRLVMVPGVLDACAKNADKEAEAKNG